MCIILNAVKKRHVKRGEVIESMKVNSSGFFMAALKADGSRDTIRTLDDKEALKFFDERVGEEDYFVMHARIPSRGEKTIENVHGWESDGIIFMHNMTLSDLDDMMKRVDWKGTDSEFFFRKIFIPFYRGLGAEAYKDGKFHPDLDNVVKHFVGFSNKFCFIMPDNKVIRYGNWVSEEDRKENGEVAFWASNSGYRITSYSGYSYGYGYGGNSAKGGSAANAAGFCGGDPDYEDYEEWYRGCGTYGGGWSNYGSGSRKRKKPKVKPAAAAPAATTPVSAAAAQEDEKFSGKVLLNVEGVEGMCELALRHMVIDNAIACRYCYSENKTEKEVEKALRGTTPRCFEQTREVLAAELKNLVEAAEKEVDAGTLDSEKVEELVAKFAARMAKAYEKPLVTVKTPSAYLATEWSVKIGLSAVKDRLDMLERLLNLTLDLGEDDPDSLAQAFVMMENADGNPEMAEVDPNDLIGMDCLTGDQAWNVTEMLLRVMNGTTDEYDKSTLLVDHSKAGGDADDTPVTLEELAEYLESADGIDRADVEDARAALAAAAADEDTVEVEGDVVEFNREDLETDATNAPGVPGVPDASKIPQIDWENHKKKEATNDSSTSVHT